MRTVLNLGLIGSAVLALAIGGGSGYLALQLGGVADESGKNPPPIKLADLIAKDAQSGPRWRLTGFRFGQTVVEEVDGQWQGVWFPLTSTDTMPPAKKGIKRGQAFYWSPVTRTSGEKEALSTARELVVLDSRRLPAASLWKRTPSATLTAVYPEAAAPEAILLGPSDLVLGGTPVIRGEDLFEPGTRRALWFVAVGGFIVAFVCLQFVSFGAKKSKRTRASQTANVTEVDGELLTEEPLSVHRFPWFRFVARTAHVAFLSVFAFFIGIFGLVAPSMMYEAAATEEGKILALVVGVAVFFGGLGALVYSFYRPYSHLRDFFTAASTLWVCTSGLRWRRGGRDDAAYWNAITRFDSYDFIQLTQGGSEVDRVALAKVTFNDGTRLTFSPYTVSHFEELVGMVRTMATEAVYPRKQEELAETGVADFGPVQIRVDGVEFAKKFLEWGDIAKIGIENGELYFYRRGQRKEEKRIALGSIPNYGVLIRMLDERVLRRL